ncbi:MAG TPA: MFS transporter [Nakamurella sp.]|nr:MFS transporter [Nakamurella sp.]
MYITVRGTPKGEPNGSVRENETGRSGKARIAPAVIGLGVVSLLTDISSESVAAILPLYITVVVGLGPLAFGFIDGIYQGISAVVRMAGGRWADRSDRPKWVAFAGYAISAVSRFGLLIATGFWAITSVVAIDRVGKGLRTGPRDALIATASEPEHLGRNFGVHRAMDTAGALIGPLMAFAILAMFPVGLSGYQTIFVFSCAFAVMGVAVLGLAVPDLRRNPKSNNGSGDQPGKAVVQPRWSDLARPALRRLMIAAGALSLVTIGDGFIYLALQDGDGVPPAYFPLLFVGTNFAYLVLAIPMGKLADRIGRARVFVAGYVLLLGCYAIAGLHLAGLVGLIAVLLMLGAFYAATDGVLAALASRLVPEASRASGISAAQTVVALARFGASIGFGLLWQFAGLSTALLVMSLGLVAAIPLAGWLLHVRTTRPQDETADAGQVPAP